MKRKECFWWVFAIIGVCLLSIRCSNVKEDYCCYVNPFIGNADNGHTFPGACVPFGMIQVSPESGNGSWRYCSGFNIEDDSIMGFSQNHLNGTGCPDLGDILILPFCGDIQNEKYKSRYEKEYQKALEKYTLLLDKATPREAKTVNLLLCELYIKWAVDMSEQNKFDESFEYLKNATQYNTLNPEIYYNVAKNNYKKKDFTACVEAINKALEYDKQNEYKSKYLLMLSEAHHQLGNFFEEKKALTDLLKYDDKNPEGLYRVGLMYTAQHDIKNAEDAVNTFCAFRKLNCYIQFNSTKL